MNYNRALLFGRWYRNDIDSQGRQIVEYAELSADGSFEFTFVSTEQETNVIEQIVELGDWGGTYQTNEWGKTKIEGIYIIGDAKNNFTGVIGSAAEGSNMAEMITHEIIETRWVS